MQKKSYKVEEGYFLDGDLYNGYRMYYSSNHVLLEKKRVVKGVEDKTILKSDIVISEIDTNLLAPRDAYFIGGESAFISFLDENFNQSLIDSIGIAGTIYAEFVINENGIVSSCQIKKSLHPLLDCELKRVIMLSPQWLPAVCIPTYVTDPHENPNYVETYVYCKSKLIIPFKIVI
ncbi:MAG: hypothetical protein IPM74_16900 [Crocinitomicaceae bacterium]|nr:hypothetical protein [Crocinitomicaceae bacterium]